MVRPLNRGEIAIAKRARGGLPKLGASLDFHGPELT
jgi:hypothetical protein